MIIISANDGFSIFDRLLFSLANRNRNRMVRPRFFIWEAEPSPTATKLNYWLPFRTNTVRRAHANGNYGHLFVGLIRCDAKTNEAAFGCQSVNHFESLRWPAGSDWRDNCNFSPNFGLECVRRVSFRGDNLNYVDIDLFAHLIGNANSLLWKLLLQYAWQRNVCER